MLARCKTDMIERKQKALRRELDLAGAELGMLKQKLVLQHLIDTGEPSEEARRVLARLRDVAARLSEGRRRADGEVADEQLEPTATSFREECTRGS